MGQNVPKLYKSVRVVQIVIVEDVLVLVYGRFVRHIRLVYGVLLVGIELFYTAAGPAVAGCTCHRAWWQARRGA